MGARGVESLARRPAEKQRSSGTGGRRKRKGNLPKRLPLGPFAGGGACGLPEQPAPLRCWARAPARDLRTLWAGDSLP